MRKSWVLCVLMGALAWGQAAPNGPPTQSSPAAGTGAMNGQAEETEKDASASVPPSAPVITIDGVCDTPAKTTTGAAAKPATATKTAAAGCKTVITKAQFDAMANNLAPNITPQLKKQLASVLPRLMAMADEAKSRAWRIRLSTKSG